MPPPPPPPPPLIASRPLASSRRRSKATFRRREEKTTIAWLILSVIGSFLLIAGAQGEQQSNEPQLLHSNLVNLNDLLEHQRALEAQCRQLENEKLDELKQLLEFSRELGDDLQLDDRVSLKLPAICLMLIGPPKLAADVKSASQSKSARARLEFVNWIYDHDDLLQVRRSSPMKRSKRQASSLFAESVANNSTTLLNDYWLDLKKLETSGENEIADSSGPADVEKVRFHEQTQRMLADERFQEAIKQVGGDKLAPYLSPVILVPGLAGSRIQARVVAKKPKVNIICSRQSGWQDMWLTLRSFLPVAIDCWIDNVRMEFNPATGFTSDAAGVESRVPDFGSVESVRHLDLKSPKLTKYFQAIIERYEQLGYQPDKNLFAAPYDFRLAPQQLEATFFQPLKQLIEFAHSSDGLETFAGSLAAQTSGRLSSRTAKKVTLVCHSMGCTHLLIFLRSQTGAWRQSRIRKLIALSSPWGGTVKALKALLVGEQFGLPLVSESKMRKLARTFPGVAYMMPQAAVFERPSKNEVDFGKQLLVQTPQRNFHINELEALLKEAQMERQWQWFEQATSLVKPLEPLPDVNIDCLHSLNIPTPETILFRNATDFPDGEYEVIQGDGDGTVNHQSLLVCDSWASQLPERVRHKIIMNTNHVGVLSHKSTLEHLTDDVLANI